MTDQEKMLMLDLLLRDMRGAFPCHGDKRLKAAMSLAVDLGLEKHQDSISELETYDYMDGRHFRTSVEYGGYEGLEDMHRLKATYFDKSEEFKDMAVENMTYPEYRFDDWEITP
jgi:hypothetical protein